MKLLALDTATEACSAAFIEFSAAPAAPTTLITRELTPGRGHSEHILRMVQEVLAEAGAALGQLDAIAFGRGPGAFTGVRLAASITQGLAFAAGLPVIPISDLQAMAQWMLNQIPTAAAVLVCNDARMQEVYWTCCGRDAAGLAASLLPERVGAAAAVELPTAQEAALPGPLYGAGSGFRAYPPLGIRLGPLLQGINEGLLPHAREIAQLARAQLAAGRLLPPEQALPVYLREEVARPPSPGRG